MAAHSARQVGNVRRCIGLGLGLASIVFAGAQDFGQVQINGATRSQLVTLTFSGLSVAPSLSLAWSRDFQFGAGSCSVAAVTTCNVVIDFTPARPGVRWDAITAQDQNGNVLSTTLLHGIGVGPLIALYPGIINTTAGNGMWGYQDNPNPANAQFRSPQGIALDAANANLYLADSINHVIRKIVLASGAVTTVAGNGTAAFSGDGGLATAASLNTPTEVAIDPAGNLYIADQGNNVIRKVSAATQIISTVAGGGASGGADGFGDQGQATSAILFGPQGIAVDGAGNLYIADSFHHLVRVVSASTGVISVLAGGGSGGGQDGLGDGAAATSARLNNPTAVALDSASNVYIADTGNNMIRRVDAVSGIITAVAGAGAGGYSGDYGLAVNATLDSPQGVVLDAAGNIYISDTANSVVRQVSAQSGIITTIAGQGVAGYSGDGGLPTRAYLSSPGGLALDPNGNFFIADCGNNVVRQVDFSPPSLSFPDTALDAVSPAQLVHPLNIGNANLHIAEITLNSGFAQTPNGLTDCSANANLPPGGSCDILTEFAPAVAGPATGTLQLTTNSLNYGGTTQTVNLSGNAVTGATPALSFSTTAVAFPLQRVGTAAAAQTVTLTNNGTGGLSFVSIWLTGSQSSDYSFSTTCPVTLAPAATCQITIGFTPLATGARTATIMISDTLANSPQAISLSGTGSGGVASLSATSLTFSGTVGLTSPAQTVVISNTANLPMNFSGIWLSGTNAADFTLSTACGTSLAGGSSCSTTVTFSPLGAGTRTATLNFADDASSTPQVVSLNGVAVAVIPSTGLRFVPITPCRIADTRGGTGSFGGPILSAGVARNFAIPNSSCGVPSTALAYSLNFTVVPPGVVGFLSVWPSGQAQPPVSLLNSDGRIKANAAIVPAGASGAITVYSSHATHLIIDINGYFVSASNLTALGYYNLTPCRVADTRSSTPLTAGVARVFSPLSSSCNVPATAQAYSLNLTVIPKIPVRFLATWPAGQPQPVVSTLNTSTTTVTANAAIVPAGSNGDINVYSSDATDLIIDINGYFAPATATGALSLFPVTPCRVIDTRFSGGGVPVNGTLGVAVTSSSCALPSTSQAFVLNATVVPLSNLGFLSLWPNGQAQPLVSTLNASDAAITSNMAIVPTNNGSVDAYGSSPTHLILDVSSYFAP